MEKVGSLDRVTIISVLSEGRDLANELRRKLHPTSGSCDTLVENILSSYENAIKLLDKGGGIASPAAAHLSNEGSPVLSEGSHISSKSKKRKALLRRCTERVRVRGSETGFEGGYNWRKYGQKDILGANHPRAYYRCTHRNTQGCLATKQVQRADEDPSVFEVIFRGKHSCVQENKESGLKKEDEEESPISSQEILVTENRESVTRGEGHFPPFSFPSTPFESENLEGTFFPETSDFTGINYSPPFLSPATSESYFSMSQCLVNDFGNDVAEIISNPSPLANFSYGEFDVLIDQIDFNSQISNLSFVSSPVGS